MDKSILQKHIENKLPIREIIKETGKSFTTIRYWIKKHKLVEYKRLIDKETKVERTCNKCKTSKNISQFYNRRGISGSSVYCKICTKKETIDRCRKFKSKCVEYKGGKCTMCGYEKYEGALEFHHLDPSKKDFSISNLKRFTFGDLVKEELNKCILVCANCHREIHGLVVPPRIELGTGD